MSNNIKWTITDEAPALATFSFLPIVRAMTQCAGINVETSDISLAGRILALFPTPEQQFQNALAGLGQLVKTPEANVIKLPNISASIPQLKAAIAELQAAGFKVPDYPEDPQSDEEEAIKAKYGIVKGSAVNPVLREGNSDRRAPNAVKEFAKANPHSMGVWDANSKTRVACMNSGDFRNNEKSLTVTAATTVDIVFEDQNGETEILKKGLPLLAGEIFDGSVMEHQKLVEFLSEQIAEAKKQGVLFSLHMKATMMKVSDPIIFGACVKVFFADLIEKHGATFEELGVDFNNGFGDLISKIENLTGDKKSEILADIDACFEAGPELAMVNSDKGITNLHVPSDVIIDASMPAMIRTSGQMWDRDGKQQDTLAVIPDSSYGPIYDVTVRDCQTHGAFDPTTMGTVQNLGLMAQKAEEYGSHDKTFQIEGSGVVRVVDSIGNILMEHQVNEGDIWRGCQTKDAPIQNWVELAVARSKATGFETIFWLDEDRAHDAEILKKVKAYLPENSGIQVLSPVEATKVTIGLVRKGENVISVTGNVLRDYLTDLFPILEVGTSAKMLSIVPLMEGGGLFETGAGGSAPKHVEQLLKENHLRWDSLGEFLALAVSLEHFGEKTNNPKAKVLAAALDKASTRVLMDGKSPSRKVGEIDTRGSHFYLALFWAEELANQEEDTELQEQFSALADQLSENEATICKELLSVQGSPSKIGGQYFFDQELASAVMRPSTTLNQIIDGFKAV
ncbi:UNVERIFIED_CONTAM: hypothetical protein GTU68_012165 [Idotea baltica]|nr:hypothetical protein [Idotea baltica]